MNSSQGSPSDEGAGKVDEALKRGEKSLVSSGKPPKPSLPPHQEPLHAPPDRGIRFLIETARPPLPGLLPPPRVLPDAGANPPSPPSRPDAEAIRAAGRGGGIRAGIRENRRGRKKARKGRPRRFDEKADPAIGSSVERFLVWRKGGFRRLS